MKREKRVRLTFNLVLMSLLVIAALVLGSGKETPARHALSSVDGGRTGGTGAEGVCADLTGKWTTTTSEERSTWEFTRASDSAHVYQARLESGAGGDARGMAGLAQENVLRLEFDVRTREGERYSGIYRCKLDQNCQSSTSPCKLVLGQGRTGTYEATIKRQ